MLTSRRAAIAVVFGVVAAVNAVILWGVLGTVFFAITVAYVLLPLSTWVRRRGYSPWTASAITTAMALLGTIALFAPLVAILYLRRAQLVAIITAIPDTVPIEVGEFSYVVEVEPLIDAATGYLAAAAPAIAIAAPIVAAKAIMFAFIVFAILYRREALARALLGAIPEEYHGIARAYHERIRQTLHALYVTQAATGLATFLIAVPVFWLFGYENPFALALVAGLLQFLPVIGPSVVVIVLAAFEAIQGAIVGAVVFLVVGLVLIAFLPDAVLRPRLARETAHLPASLYFVGFTGGVLSLGAIGILAGPLAVALLAETVSLLADDTIPDSD